MTTDRTKSSIRRLPYAALDLPGDQRALLLNLVQEYYATFVPRSDPPSQLVDHQQPLYERRRAEDLRAGDVIWWNNSEALVMHTNAREAVATRDMLVHLRYMTAYIAYSADLLRSQVVPARVRAPYVTDRAMDGLLDDEAFTTLPFAFWRAVADALLVSDVNIDDSIAQVVARFPRIDRANDALPHDPRMTERDDDDDDDDHDDDQQRDAPSNT